MKASDILTRLKAATGPDRGIDMDILEPTGGCSHKETEYYCIEDGNDYDSGYTCKKCGADTYGAKIDRYTASIDDSIALVKQMLPGWSWRIAQCCVSDDAWVIPDFNDPVHGPCLLDEWPLECQRDPLEYLRTDIDRRPAGNPALALLEALFTALAAKKAGDMIP